MGWQRHLGGVSGGGRRARDHGPERRFKRGWPLHGPRLAKLVEERIYTRFCEERNPCAKFFRKGVGGILWKAANVLQNKLARAQYLDE